jgi:hypothetical protein
MCDEQSLLRQAIDVRCAGYASMLWATRTARMTARHDLRGEHAHQVGVARLAGLARAQNEGGVAVVDGRPP